MISLIIVYLNGCEIMYLVFILIYEISVMMLLFYLVLSVHVLIDTKMISKVARTHTIHH